MIDSIVSKVFCITTIKSNRFSYIDRHLKDNGIKFEYFIAVDKSIITDTISVKDSREHKSSISLTSAYVSLIERARIEQIDSISIIEDDCFFINGWKEKFRNFIENVPNWDLLNLGYYPTHDTLTVKERINQFVYKPLACHYTTHCMVIKNKCYNKFLFIAKELNYSVPIDYIFQELYEDGGFNCFYPCEKFIYQLSYRKDSPSCEIPGNNMRFESFLF